MGMFTTIVTEDDEIQIRTGYDECEYYKLGQPIRVWYGKDIGIDDVYDGWGNKGRPQDTFGATCWVIVKDNTPVAIEPFTGADHEYDDLVHKWGVKIDDPHNGLDPDYKSNVEII